MDYNKSLSARVKRRNKAGFKGEGSDAMWVKNNSYGDYKDAIDSNKHDDYNRELARKEKMGFHNTGGIPHYPKHIMSKRYADNHQKL